MAGGDLLDDEVGVGGIANIVAEQVDESDLRDLPLRA
jgi:hypothetical protein